MAEARAQPALARRASSRTRFASTIVLGHALKHVYISGLSAVLLPEIKIGLGLSAAQVGAMASVQQFTGWFATMASGYVGDRFTNRTSIMLALSLALTGISYFILGAVEGYALLLAAMLLVGLGPSIYHPPAISALSRRFSDRRAFAVSMHGTGGSLGEVLGPVTAALLVSVLVWQDVLKLSMFPALIAAFFMWSLLRRDDATSSSGSSSLKQYLGSFSLLLHNRAVLLLCLVSALRSVGQTTTMIFLPVYLREDLAYSAGLVGLYLSMAQLVGIGSQPLMGYLADRFGHRRVLLPALVAFAFLLLSLALVEGRLEFALAILAIGTFLFSLHAIIISAAMEAAGDREHAATLAGAATAVPGSDMHATIVSLIYGASFVGALAPTLAGVLSDEYGLRSTFIFSAALVGAAAAVMAVTRLPGRSALSR